MLSSASFERQAERDGTAPGFGPGLPLSGAELDRFYEFVRRIAHPDAAALGFPGLEARPWYRTGDFPCIASIEAAYPSIRDELMQLREGRGFQPETEVERLGSWNVYFLYELGVKNAKNCAACPRTTALIESIPEIQKQGGMVYFSALNPDSHILPHKGASNLRLRCHLGLQVPPEGCAIRVDGEARTWEEGKCLLFDDSFEHEVWNRSDRTRFVLIFDLWHPGLTTAEIAALEGFRKYVTRQSRALFDFWKNNQRARETMVSNDWWN